jgi:mannan polymerase II complex MNN10 subunit
MLMRPLKVPPSLLLVIVFCVFLAIHFSPISLPTQPSPGPSSERKAPRIALVTFVTEERSYLHLALKSKNREWLVPRTQRIDLDVDRLLPPTRL